MPVRRGHRHLGQQKMEEGVTIHHHLGDRNLRRKVRHQNGRLSPNPTLVRRDPIFEELVHQRVRGQTVLLELPGLVLLLQKMLHRRQERMQRKG